jgi:drug/metabolite transporter (DMT)-like permease
MWKSMHQDKSNNGLLYALAGFSCLTFGDAIIKSMGGQWPGTAVAALRYCIGALGLGIILWVKEGHKGFTVPMPKTQLMRGFGVSFATLCFFTAIFLMPLAEATAITYISPMIIAVMSSLFLNEREGKAAWIAIFAAFVGVIIILRPNVNLLGWTAFLPLLAAFFMAIMIIGNRKVANAGSPLQMQFLIAAIAALILVVAAFFGHLYGPSSLRVDVPDWTVFLRCTIVALTASFSHWLVYMSTTKTSAARIAPAVYIQVIIAFVLGILIFEDWPDLLSLLGTTIIISAGIYHWNNKRALETGRM